MLADACVRVHVCVCLWQASIKARFGLEEPPLVYQDTGSEYLGRRVRRNFGKKNSKTVVGR